MNCARCNRTLKNPSISGFGPKCERAVLGQKPRRIKREPRAQAPDEKQQPLFQEAA